MPNLLQHSGKCAIEKRIPLCRDEEKGISVGVVHPVVGGTGQDHLAFLREYLRYLSHAVIRPHVPIDIQIAQNVLVLLGNASGHGPQKLMG